MYRLIPIHFSHPLNSSEANLMRPVFSFKIFVYQNIQKRSSRGGTVETNLTGNHEVAGSTPGLTQWVKALTLLWLWCRPAAVALIRPLAQEPPYVVGVAL